MRRSGLSFRHKGNGSSTLLPMKRITSALIALTVAASSLVAASQPAQAASTKPFFCKATTNNSLLHPTYTVRCYNTKKQYRAGAWCQTYRAWGPWVKDEAPSKATCFFLFVDNPKSIVELR